MYEISGRNTVENAYEVTSKNKFSTQNVKFRTTCTLPQATVCNFGSWLFYLGFLYIVCRCSYLLVWFSCLPGRFACLIPYLGSHAKAGRQVGVSDVWRRAVQTDWPDCYLRQGARAFKGTYKGYFSRIFWDFSGPYGTIGAHMSPALANIRAKPSRKNTHYFSHTSY